MWGRSDGVVEDVWFLHALQVDLPGHGVDGVLAFDAGVEVTERLEPGVTHGHLNSSPADSAGTENTLRAMAEFIRTSR